MRKTLKKYGGRRSRKRTLRKRKRKRRTRRRGGTNGKKVTFYLGEKEEGERPYREELEKEKKRKMVRYASEAIKTPIPVVDRPISRSMTSPPGMLSEKPPAISIPMRKKKTTCIGPECNVMG